MVDHGRARVLEADDQGGSRRLRELHPDGTMADGPIVPGEDTCGRS
ncbi:hypothetical protein [Actinomadura sp. DC4]|nr:hypothetical protein [Actinomadura sp. DC4]MDN3354128.1 hypothetical protein [Actinomadura sp. DC4]